MTIEPRCTILIKDKKIKLIVAIDAIDWTEDNANSFIGWIEIISKYGGDQDYCGIALISFLKNNKIKISGVHLVENKPNHG